MKRGQIWWADLSEPRGSEPGGRRPVLIVQDDLLTSSSLPTVMVAPMTTNLKRALALGNVQVSAADTGLAKDSVVLVCQVFTLDKAFLEQPVGTLGRRALQNVDLGLQLALDLGRL